MHDKDTSNLLHYSPA